MPIRRKPIKILSTHQSNRLLVYKPPRIRLIIPEEVVMQPCFTVGVLVLQSEGVICTIRYLGFLFQSAPDGVVGEPNQIVVLIGNLFREADFGRSGSCGFVGNYPILCFIIHNFLSFFLKIKIFLPKRVLLIPKFLRISILQGA